MENMSAAVQQDVLDRPRKVDVEKLTEEQLESISKYLGDKIGEFINEVCDKSRKILDTYGLDIKIGYVLFEKGSDPDAHINKLVPKKKKPRKVKVKVESPQ